MNVTQKLILILAVLILALIIFRPHQAKAQVVIVPPQVVVGVPCTPFTPCYQNAYNYCVEQCLETYANVDLTYACEQYCQANPQVVVVLPNNGWFGRGHYIPRGGHYPRDDRHDRSDRHDHDNRGRR